MSIFSKMLTAALLVPTLAFGGIDLTKSRIVVPKSSDNTAQQAAQFLADHIHKISGKTVQIVDGKKAAKGDVFIVHSDDSSITEDGFKISTDNGILCVGYGEGKGAIYGIADILEKNFGVRYWSPAYIDIPKSETMILEEGLNYASNPSFEHRQVQVARYSENELLYRYFNRTEVPEDLFVPGYWVHTFDKLVPSAKYGKSHPEYYALINGERRPGVQAQLCLTNDDVLEIVVQQVDSLFKLYPDRKMISVSQNDGKFAHCTCDKCSAIDEREETLMGSILYFVNKVAERFPDKEISTLSYLYSVEPPKYMRPLPNVNIMLCNIDCTRELPLEDTDNGREFLGYQEQWGKICNNIYMWDYGINFSNSVSPFPNFHVLAPNVRQFHKNNITKKFSQINSGHGVDFSELRSYMLAKLSWDHTLDGDSLMREFVFGYYGDAAPYMYDYLKLQQGALMASGTKLWIFDAVPVHKNGMLRPILIDTYNKLFDQAEAAVKDSPEYLERVKLSRLSLQYAELEVARTIKGLDRAVVEEKLKFFSDRVDELKLLSLEERGGSPTAYCDTYVERFLPSSEKNLADGAKIDFITSPKGGYAKIAEASLTDGLYGGNTFVESWIGWEGKDVEFVIDLGAEQNISSVEIDCLHQLGQWVFSPIEIKYSISQDGKNFTNYGEITKPWDEDPKVLYKQYKIGDKPAKARYVKVWVKGVENCPAWHYGVGNPGWIFIDEVVVR